MALAEDLAWRKLELSVLSKALDIAARKSDSSPETRALSRALVALSYAHWEGYARNGLDVYCRYISKRRLHLNAANDALLLGHALRLLKRRQSGHRDAELELVDLLRGKASGRILLVRSDMVDTKSNLRYERLTDLLDAFGLDRSRFELLANLIDVRLCDRRNAVAHGRGEFPDAQDTLTLKDEVVDLLEQIRSLLTQAVSGRYFARAAGIETA